MKTHYNLRVIAAKAVSAGAGPKPVPQRPVAAVTSVLERKGPCAATGALFLYYVHPAAVEIGPAPVNGKTISGQFITCSWSGLYRVIYTHIPAHDTLAKTEKAQ